MATESSELPKEPYESLVEVISEEKASKLATYPEAEGELAATPGYVYVIQERAPNPAQVTGLLKVGFSGNPATRLRNLQTGNARRLQFLRMTQVNNMSGAEAAAKNALAGYSVNYGGGTEWFIAVGNVALQAFLQTFDTAVAPF